MLIIRNIIAGTFMQYKCVHAGDVLSVHTARLINACSEIIHQTLHVLEKSGDTVWLVSAPVYTGHNSSEFFFRLKLCLCHSYSFLFQFDMVFKRVASANISVVSTNCWQVSTMNP